jgi:hypothetical protein
VYLLTINGNAYPLIREAVRSERGRRESSFLGKDILSIEHDIRW